MLGDHCDRMMGVKLRCSECSDEESMSVTYDFLWFCWYFEEGAVISGWRGVCLQQLKLFNYLLYLLNYDIKCDTNLGKT